MSAHGMFENSMLVSLFSFAVGLFLWAGWTDMRTMRIPNLVSLGLIAAWALRAIFVPDTVSVIADPAFAIAVFIPFFVLYTVGNGGFGAGDVKLITTGSLWFGWNDMPQGALSLIPSQGSLSIGFIFLVVMGIAGMFQSLYAIAKMRRMKNGGAPGFIARAFSLFRPQPDGSVHATAAVSTVYTAAIEGMAVAFRGVGIVKEVEGRLKVPYGPSIVVGALVAFWAQLATWGIL